MGILLRYLKFVVFSISLSLYCFAQTTVNLNPAKDNTIYENAATSNGAGIGIFAGTTGQPANNIRRGLMAFSTAGSIPEGATVTSATLTLQMTRTGVAAGAQLFGIHLLTSDWGEGTSDAHGVGGPGTGGGAGAPATANDATWSNAFTGGALWTTAGGDFNATASASLTVDGLGSYTWSSTPNTVSDVQGWINSPATDFGWLLLGNEAANPTAKRFDSREGAVPPVLTVTYTDPLFDGSDVTLNVPNNSLQSFFDTGEQTGIDIDFTNLNTAGNIQVQSFATAPVSPTGITGNVSDYRWVVTPAGLDINPSGAQIQIDWSTIPNAGILTPATVVIYQRATPGSGAFTALGTTVLGGTELVATISSFGEFALGSTDTDNALPVSLSLFEAIAQDQGVLLRWTTESEVNNEAFIIERSAISEDGPFGNIGEVAGQGNTNRRHHYEFTDSDVDNGNTYYYRLADRDLSGVVTHHHVVTATPAANSNSPGSFALHPNFPNPFNPQTTIAIDLPDGNHSATLTIYDISGRVVKQLLNGPLAAGKYRYTWDATDENNHRVSSGLYIYRLSDTAGRSQTRRMLLVR